MKQFPKWKYAVRQAVIVENEEQEAALDGEWFDLPDQLDAHLADKAKKIDADLAKKKAGKAADDDLNKQIEDLKGSLDKHEGEELPSVEVLRATAAERGIEVHPRAGAKKIAEQIKADIEAKGE